MIRLQTFTETAVGTSYTVLTSVPAGARLLDVLVESYVAWTAATADLDIGDDDAPDALCKAFDVTSAGFNSGVNLGGTAWGDPGGDGAPYSDSASGGTGKWYPTGSAITLTVTAGTPGGPTGITLVSLVLELPTTRRAAIVT